MTKTAKVKHWTENSVEDFLYEIAADFVDQLQLAMNSIPLTQAELAKRLQLTRGRVSQIFKNPGNLSLKHIIKYARALGLKVALVAYDDKDPQNTNGPVNSEIFRLSWESVGSPRDFRSLHQVSAVTVSIRSYDRPWGPGLNVDGKYKPTGLTISDSGAVAGTTSTINRSLQAISQ